MPSLITEIPSSGKQLLCLYGSYLLTLQDNIIPVFAIIGAHEIYQGGWLSAGLSYIYLIDHALVVVAWIRCIIKVTRYLVIIVESHSTPSFNNHIFSWRCQSQNSQLFWNDTLTSLVHWIILIIVETNHVSFLSDSDLYAFWSHQWLWNMDDTFDLPFPSSPNKSI